MRSSNGSNISQFLVRVIETNYEDAYKAAKEKVKASILRAEALASSSSSSRNSIAQTSSTEQQISDADISSLRDKRKREDRDGVSKRAKNENIMFETWNCNLKVCQNFC